MDIPKHILDNGTVVKYHTDYKGEKVEKQGVIKDNTKDNCFHRTLKDLTYYIEEDSDTMNIEMIHHSDVYEVILCPHCNENLLENGVYEGGWVTHRFDYDSQESRKIWGNSCDGILVCDGCDSNLKDEKLYNKLRRYLDI